MSSGGPTGMSSAQSDDQTQHQAIIRQLLRNTKSTDTKLEVIVNEFSKSLDDANVPRLMGLLEEMSRAHPEARVAYNEVKNNVYNMEPYEMLDTFLQTYQFRCDLRRSREFSAPKSEVADQGPSTKTPSNHVVDGDNPTHATNYPENSISDIKNRVLAAATSGLSKSARSTPLTANTHEPANLGVPRSMDYSGILSPVSQNCVGGVTSRRQIWQTLGVDMVQFQPTSALALPTTAQDQIMIRELLTSLIACSTRYISCAADLTCNAPNLHELNFTVSSDINCSLRQMVDQLLPMGSQYAIINEFILQQEDLGGRDTPENRCSQTLQALASALEEVLDEYRTKLVSLEADAACLTIPKILHILRNTQHTMAVCAQSVIYIRKHDLNAAQILSYLNEKITSLTGDEIAQSVHVFLAERAAVPFISILQNWVVKGMIIDPMAEFMLEEKTTGIKAADALDRYILRADRIPEFLRNVADMILRTGKYLNVVRNCGHQVYCQMDEPLRFEPQTNHHMAYLKAAYDYSSHRLLEILVKENDLMGHLTSVKRYLLMQQGDFISQYMDTIDDELWKPAATMNANKMASLLELTLRLSSAKDDAYKDELMNDPSDHDLVKEVSAIHKQQLVKDIALNGSEPQDLKGYECFCFSFVAPWPVSLVINRDTLQPYTMVFRMMFYLKHVERQLNKMWMHNMYAKKLETKMNDSQRASFSITQRMLHTIQNIEYYIMLEVIEPLWQKFLLKMDAVRNVDEVLAAHKSFTDELAQQGMMHSVEIVQAIIKICKICIRFSQTVLSENVTLPSKTFASKVAKYNKVFSVFLLDFLEKIVNPTYSTSTDRLLNLVHRLNFNLYFTDKLDVIAKKRSAVSGGK